MQLKRKTVLHFSWIIALFGATALSFNFSQSSRNASANDIRQPREAHVVFYNVENLFDTIIDPEKQDDDFSPSGKYTWNTARYYEKCDRLAEVIAMGGKDGELPAIVGLCEVENEAVLRDLVQREPLRKGKYEIIHFPSLDVRGIDVALLYRPKIFTPEHVETFFVNLGSAKRPTRDILYVQGMLKGNLAIHLFVNHWPSRYGGQEKSEPNRMAAAEILRTAVDEIISEDPNAAVLVMGDFNDYPSNRSLREALGAKGPEETGLLVNLMDASALDQRGTYNYRGEWGFLDQFIVSRSMHEGGLVMVKPGSAQAYASEEMLFIDPKYGDEKPFRSYFAGQYQGGYSDHLPIRLTLLY